MREPSRPLPEPRDVERAVPLEAVLEPGQSALIWDFVLCRYVTVMKPLKPSLRSVVLALGMAAAGGLLQ